MFRLFSNFFWPGQISQVDVHQVSFLTSVRPIYQALIVGAKAGIYIHLVKGVRLVGSSPGRAYQGAKRTAFN